MSSNLAPTRGAFALAQRLKISPEKLELIRSQIAPGAPDDVLELYFERCRISGFDPFAKLLYVIGRKDRDNGRVNWTMQTSIDGFRSQAEDTREYDGQDEPRFTFDSNGRLLSATVTVYRKGMGRGISATADWAEYAIPNAPMWKKMPKGQLAKCAEALALRKAFPKKLQGIYTSDEMEQAGRGTLNASAGAPPPAEEPARPALPPQEISMADLQRDHERLFPGQDFKVWIKQNVTGPKATTISREQREKAREILDDLIMDLTTTYEVEATVAVTEEADEASFVETEPEPPKQKRAPKVDYAELGRQAMERARSDQDAFAGLRPEPDEGGILI